MCREEGVGGLLQATHIGHGKGLFPDRKGGILGGAFLPGGKALADEVLIGAEAFRAGASFVGEVGIA